MNINTCHIVILNIYKVILASNNPRKKKLLEDAGITVIDRVDIGIKTNEIIEAYLSKKVTHLGHHEKD